MPRAILLFREKAITERGDLVEALVWRVAVTPRSPGGVRYRLAFVRHGESVPAVLYDNHAPKGHHRHVGGVEERYEFVDVDRLLADFMRDVRQASGGS